MSKTGAATRRGRPGWTLLALVLLFFGPMAVSVYFYFTPDGWRPARSTAHGVLLEEPLALEPVGWRGAAGEPVVLMGKWQLIHVARGDCGAGCEAALVATRQVRRALGRDMQRVQRVLWVEGAAPAPQALAEHPGLLLLQPPPAEAERILAASGPAADGDVLLVDPRGNLVMRFPAGTPMADLHGDLKRLLKASQIG